MMDVAVSCDLRHMFGAARDQGARATCAAFAASDAHAAVRAGWSPLSCEYAFYHAVKRTGEHPGRGVAMSAVLETLREEGQPVEEAWPYLPVAPADLSDWVPPLDVGPCFQRDSRAVLKSVGEIVRRLERSVPVVLSFRLSEAFFSGWDENGVVAQDAEPSMALRHAAVAAGHGMHGSERWLLIRNSWGVGWGCGGYGWVGEEYLDRALLGATEMTRDLTQMPMRSDVDVWR